MRSRAAVGASALALAFGCAGVLAGDARATYPGADGRISFGVALGCYRYAEEGDPCSAQSYRALLAASPLGGAARTLVRCPGPACVESVGSIAVWSPDGRLLAANVAPSGGRSQIAILGADGRLVRLLAVPESVPIGWLPDGRRVAVLSDTRVFVVPAAGGPVRAVAGPRGARAWSVRGDIAISRPEGIAVRRAADGRRRLLLRTSERIAYGRPDWSPDGRRLAVVRTNWRTSLSTLISVPARGGRSRVVVRGPATGCFGDPVWSPSGRRLAFTSGCLDEDTDEDTYEAPPVYTVRADGTGLRRVFDPRSLDPTRSLVAYAGPTVSWQARP